MKRQPSRSGLSYFDANSGRLITEGPDVLKVKTEIESRWDVLSCYFDTVSEEWVIIEKCSDGVERLALKTKKLDMGVVQKLQRIDQAAHPQGDVNRKLELEDAQTDKEKDHNLSEAVGEGAERLFWALRKDGILHIPKVHFSGLK